MQNLKGAVFDLDGTLLDSMGVWEEIDRLFLSSRGICVSEAYLRAVTPMGFLQAAQYTIERFSLQDTPQALIEIWNEMAKEAYSTAVRLKPFAKEYLLFLKERGVRLSIATASPKTLYVPALKNNGVYNLFDSFVTLAQVKRGKGFPDIYCKAAKTLALKPEQCAVFEDIYEGVCGARSGGFYTVGVYDAWSAHEQAQIKQKANLYIHSFKQLLESPGLLAVGQS